MDSWMYTTLLLLSHAYCFFVSLFIFQVSYNSYPKVSDYLFDIFLGISFVPVVLHSFQSLFLCLALHRFSHWGWSGSVGVSGAVKRWWVRSGGGLPQPSDKWRRLTGLKLGVVRSAECHNFPRTQWHLWLQWYMWLQEATTRGKQWLSMR